MIEADKRRVIGFFAADGGQVLAHENACIVSAGTAPLKSLMRARTPRDKLGNALDMTVKKIRLEAILLGLASGGAYAFDQEAYERFYPMANRYGYLLKEEDFAEPADGGLALVTIRR